MLLCLQSKCNHFSIAQPISPHLNCVWYVSIRLPNPLSSSLPIKRQQNAISRVSNDKPILLLERDLYYALYCVSLILKLAHSVINLMSLYTSQITLLKIIHLGIFYLEIKVLINCFWALINHKKLTFYRFHYHLIIYNKFSLLGERTFWLVIFLQSGKRKIWQFASGCIVLIGLISFGRHLIPLDL